MTENPLWRKLNTLLVIAIFAILIAGTYLGLTGQWIAADINRWQMRVMNDHKYFPALTAFIIAIPPMVALLPLKIIIKRRLKS